MKDENRLTGVAARVFERINRVDAKFKEMGKMPFGKVKATPKEQREAFNKLTPQDIQGLVQKYGPEEVNEYIRKMMEGR